MLSVAVPILAAISATALSVRGRGWSPPVSVSAAAAGTDQAGAGGSSSQSRRDMQILLIGAGLIVLSLIPDLLAYLKAEGSPLGYTWDTSNGITWQLLVEQGFVPMKDFFYPYGYQWLYGLRSFGPALQWLSETAMIAISAWSLWRLSGRRAWRVLACLLVLAAIAGWGQIWRYLPAVLIPLCYAALGQAGRAHTARDRLIFGATCLLAALTEPDLLGLGLLGVVFVLIGELVAGELQWERGRVLGELARDAVPVIAAAALVVLSWVAMDSVAGNLRFLLQFRAVSALSTDNERLQGPLGLMVLYPTATGSPAGAVPALLAAAALLVARWGAAGSRSVRVLLLGGSGVALGLLLKNFIRQAPDLPLYPALVVLAWAVILGWRRGTLLRAAALGGSLAAVLALANESQNVSSYVGAVVQSPQRAMSSVRAVFQRGARARAATAEFDPRRFTTWPDETVAETYAGLFPNRRPAPFAIIGDSQLTYVLLDQRPLYEIDMYDGARISEQEHVLDQLRARRPPDLIWQKTFDQDGISYDIRVPLLFTWMVRHYVPWRLYPDFDVLRRRLPGEPIPVGAWRSQLGPIEHLRYLPSMSSAAQSAACTGASPGASATPSRAAGLLPARSSRSPSAAGATPSGCSSGSAPAFWSIRSGSTASGSPRWSGPTPRSPRPPRASPPATPALNPVTTCTDARHAERAAAWEARDLSCARGAEGSHRAARTAIT